MKFRSICDRLPSFSGSSFLSLSSQRIIRNHLIICFALQRFCFLSSDYSNPQNSIFEYRRAEIKSKFLSLIIIIWSVCECHRNSDFHISGIDTWHTPISLSFSLSLSSLIVVLKLFFQNFHIFSIEAKKFLSPFVFFLLSAKEKKILNRNPISRPLRIE